MGGCVCVGACVGGCACVRARARRVCACARAPACVRAGGEGDTAN